MSHFSQLRARNVLGSQSNYFDPSRPRNILAVQEELLGQSKARMKTGQELL